MQLATQQITELTPESTPASLGPTPEHLQRYIRLVFGTFFIGESEFAIDMADIQEIAVPPTRLQRMPLAPPFLNGLYNLRGRILPVVDLRVLLQIEPTPPEEEDIPCLVILHQDPAVVGVLFDAVGEILRVLPRDIMPVALRNRSEDDRPNPIKSILSLNGGDRVIQVLDLSALLAIRNLPALERRSPERLADKKFVTQRMRDLRRDKLIGFTVAGCNLAFEMKAILGILDNTQIKPSPRKSALCESIVMFGKHMVPVVPLALLLKLHTTETPQRIMVCKVGDNQVGFQVEHVTSIIPFASDRVLPIPILDDHRSNVIRGCFTDQQGTEFLVLNEQGTLSNPEIVDISVGHRQLSNEEHRSEEKAIVPNISILTFRMGKLYGIKLLDVVEVLVAPKVLIRTPATPAAVLGVLNLRGTPISVLDPRQLFDLEPAALDQPASILVFLHNGKKIAMRVDSVEGIVSVPQGSESQLPDIFFQEDQPKLLDTFERGVHLDHEGKKSVVLILKASQIVKLLANAMDNPTPFPQAPAPVSRAA
jgi:purine-binding chemotaxis protein CheW